MQTVTEILCSECGAVLRMEPHGEGRVRGVCINVACCYNGRAVVEFNLPPAPPVKKKESRASKKMTGVDAAQSYTHKRVEPDTIPPTGRPARGEEEEEK